MSTESVEFSHLVISLAQSIKEGLGKEGKEFHPNGKMKFEAELEMRTEFDTGFSLMDLFTCRFIKGKNKRYNNLHFQEDGVLADQFLDKTFLRKMQRASQASPKAHWNIISCNTS